MSIHYRVIVFASFFSIRIFLHFFLPTESANGPVTDSTKTHRTCSTRRNHVAGHNEWNENTYTIKRKKTLPDLFDCAAERIDVFIRDVRRRRSVVVRHAYYHLPSGGRDALGVLQTKALGQRFSVQISPFRFQARRLFQPFLRHLKRVPPDNCQNESDGVYDVLPLFRVSPRTRSDGRPRGMSSPRDKPIL